MKRFVTLSLAVLAVVASSAQASVLSFEDVPGAVAGQPSNPIASGYAGYDWTNFFAADDTYLSSIGGNTAAVTDGHWVAVNGMSAPGIVSDSTLFNFYGATFTRPRFSSLATLTLEAYAGSVLMYSDSFTIAAMPVVKSYSWTGIDKLVFTPTKGGSPTLVAIDQLSLAPVPEPETYALMLAGLGLVGAMARRRRIGIS